MSNGKEGEMKPSRVIGKEEQTVHQQVTRDEQPYGGSNVTDFINALPGNSSVNTVQHATIEEAVFSVDPTDEPMDCLGSDQVICVCCKSTSVPRLYK
jgi:hypothetical protein